MKVVLDTNTVVSAVLFAHGRLAFMRELWMAGRFTPLGSRETSQELIRVLAYPKFRLNQWEMEVLLSGYLPFVEKVSVGQARPDGLPLCRDPNDDKFLFLAAYGRADVLVSGDRALQELKGRTAFAIESPARFRQRFFPD